jgi:hypothetical protein
MGRMIYYSIWLLPVSLMIFGCAGEPQIVTRTVEVSVPLPVPCVVMVGPEPSYSDTPDKITAAANIAERTRLLLLGRNERIAYILKLQAASSGCLRPLADVAPTPSSP